VNELDADDPQCGREIRLAYSEEKLGEIPFGPSTPPYWQQDLIPAEKNAGPKDNRSRRS
jgi:hypothetical protein